MIAAAAAMNWQDFLSTVELQTLARRGPARGMHVGLGLMMRGPLLDGRSRKDLRCAHRAS